MSAAPIPVIDLTGADEGGAARDAVARALVEAAVEHGFVYIRNTGLDIPASAINGAFDISRKLFQLPAEEKEPCKIQTNNRGWTGMHVETLDPKTQRVRPSYNWCLSTAFNFGEFVDGKAQQPLPPSLASDEPQIDAFFDLCYRLCLKLNDLLGIGLEVNPPDFFTAAHRKAAGPSGNTLRLLYYPARQDTDEDTDGVRAGAHSDYGSMTLLFRLAGQAGLEINTRDGSWVPVPVLPSGTGVETDAAPPILVNIGDLLSYWTGGLLRSTVHRVIFPPPGVDSANVTPGESTKEPRYSIAFFCHPAGASPLSAVPSKRVAEAVAEAKGKGKAIAAPDSTIMTADEHLQMRLRSTYLDLYEK
ncbi:oxidoreductase, 2OG-Fe(II) oxygenase family [Sporothrix brasiliensis 5110]|uniref:Oxidoreductase, 2OG-Fe(II) oxygenase family n=1 Tax=Sporothrix brasiliensis 5110 TaxID=1398154 RepID=A0A0C2FU04_9PEZI|nr:oxidoreductase, 2OG-Fe(II) oxygenase family [Sporothrix brasiliensis 5110]KIH94493.1 oxidoreductase, 2OG-Fe(II) oxygenase family [Sporothrix brasiliensis 5110]